MVWFQNLELNIVDMKRLEFERYKEHAWVTYDISDVTVMVESIWEEVIERRDRFAELGITKIQNYPYDDLKYKVLLIDELTQISPKMETDNRLKAFKGMIYKQLCDILAISAALGIHVITCTQRPDKDVLEGPLKANIPATICFKVRDKTNSQIVLDNDKAARLPPIKGRAILQHLVERQVQCYLIPEDQMTKYLPLTSMTRPENAPPLDDEGGEEDV